MIYPDAEAKSFAEECYYSRVKAYPLKPSEKPSKAIEYFKMGKLLNEVSPELEINFNFVVKQLDNLKQSELSYDEREMVAEAESIVEKLYSKPLTTKAFSALSDALMVIVKLSKYL